MSSLEACHSCHHVMHADHACTVLNLKERIEELKNYYEKRCDNYDVTVGQQTKRIKEQEDRIRELEGLASVQVASNILAENHRLEQRVKAYREIAASLYEWRFQRDPKLQDEWDGKTKFGDEVDNMVALRDRSTKDEKKEGI